MGKHWRRVAEWQPPKLKLPNRLLKSRNIFGDWPRQARKVRVKLADNQEIDGVLEFYDEHFIRLTRDGQPNLFLYKHDIKYLFELS